MLSVWFETLMGIRMHDCQALGFSLTWMTAIDLLVTIANANGLATTSAPAPRTIETCITQHNVYVWCVVVATSILMVICSCRQKARGRRSRRRFAEPLRDSRNQLHFTSYQLACIIMYFRFFTIGHNGGTLCSFGQGTTTGLPFLPQRQCRKSASLLFWVKFNFPAGDSSLCDKVSMCKGMSFAFCSSG